jgi:hypothetical protein
MDLNKLQVLREVGYTIPRSCTLCANSKWEGASEWGSCMITTYQHKKHIGLPRQLSIYRGGQCSKFVLEESAAATLGAYIEFIK